MAQGMDFSLSGSASAASATGATRFGPLTIIQGAGGSTGGGMTTWLLLAGLALALWFLFWRKK
jgi:LPXTG-motif cell wall-anchored protein